jgi:hypothetical protein
MEGPPVIVYRVTWHSGTTHRVEPHAEDYLTQRAAEDRLAELEAAAIGAGRRTWYRAEGDGARGCWCEECQPTEEIA